ncbi:MAG: hypothetical protein J5829_09715 [Lachnospiraceae bacterium]|nr:hypothetical protein [Lachnospiraceae bacterium]
MENEKGTQTPVASPSANSNREYKSRLFGFIFGREENREWTLALYNAINGSAHDNPADITINTLEDVVYLGMKNDLSLLVSDRVSFYRTMELYEQQSTYNPNMPIREFMYAGKLYDKYIYTSKLHRYGSKLMPLPIPKLVVLYNGEDKREDQTILRLSDAFREEIRRNIVSEKADLTEDQIRTVTEERLEKADPDIEVKVRMININYGHNRALLDACGPLREYSWFVDRVRENNKPDQTGERMSIETAIDKALDEMPEEFVIKQFLMANRAEVKDMCLTEYNEAEVMEMFKEEGREEERANTEREKARADEAENRADDLAAELAKYKAKYGDDV